MRMHMRRFIRLTDAFSKKLKNHAYAVALHQMFYNFVRIHQTLKVTPAMAAGVTDKLWGVSDIIAVVDAWEADRRANGVEYQVERERIGTVIWSASWCTTSSLRRCSASARPATLRRGLRPTARRAVLAVANLQRNQTDPLPTCRTC
jgi:hypothetical protein